MTQEVIMVTEMDRARFLRLSVALACGSAASMLLPGLGQAQPVENVKQAMALLKAKTAKLGAAEVKGQVSVGGKNVPALYFGKTEMNNNFALVDEVQQEMGGTATLFVKSGDEFVRVATNVKKDDGSRAVGTVLDPKGKAIAAINGGTAYYGEADILGKAYVTGYEPIRGSDGSVIGIYYVGYLKSTQ
jgi:Cache 3/Cache 2 fusion domain